MNGNLATDWTAEWKPLLWVVAVFVGAYWLPVGSRRFDGAVVEALALTKWYAQEHVLLCLVPGVLHRRRHLGVLEPAGSSPVSGSGCSEAGGLRGGLGVRYHPGGLLLHGASPLRRDLCNGRRPGTRLGLPLLRPRHQRPGHRTHRQRSGA